MYSFGIAGLGVIIQWLPTANDEDTDAAKPPESLFLLCTRGILIV